MKDNWLGALHLCVEDNIDNAQLTVLELARQMHMSERQIYRKVQQLTQLTPHEYCNQIRFNKAYTYLIQQKFDTIAATAKAVEDAGYFARQFKKVYGISPLELLRKKESK